MQPSPQPISKSTATRAPLTILVQGGIASGKSTIAGLLAARGHALLDCDRIAHEELEAPEVRAAVAAEFGPAVLDPAGHVQRKALGAIVFRDPAALARLEALIHPRVRTRVAGALQAHHTPTGEARHVVIIDAAVADKMELVPSYDLRVFVTASAETRRRRAEEIRGWPPGELERREAQQSSLSAKAREADHVIPNDGDLAEAEGHVERLWTQHVVPHQ